MEGNSPAQNWVEVRSLKHDGLVHRTWKAKLINREGSLLLLDGVFDADVEHDLLGTITGGTHSLEYYWLDRWYNVFRFAHPDGRLRNYYCNVNVPPTFENNVLSYIDLDLDILVEPDGKYRIVDVDEFEKNATRFGYPAEIRTNAHRALDELTQMIRARVFPFDR